MERKIAVVLGNFRKYIGYPEDIKIQMDEIHVFYREDKKLKLRKAKMESIVSILQLEKDSLGKIRKKCIWSKE